MLPNFATTCCSTPFTLLILIPVKIFGGMLVFISLAALIWSYSKSIIVIILETLHTYLFYIFHPYVAFWKSLYPGSKEYSHSSSTQSENRQFSPDWMCGGKLRHGDVRSGLQIYFILQLHILHIPPCGRHKTYISCKTLLDYTIWVLLLLNIWLKES